VWMLMRGFSEAQDFTQLAPWVSGSLVFMFLALTVTLPAAVAKIVFQTSTRHRTRELVDFRVEVSRLFERSFGPPREETEEKLNIEDQKEEEDMDESEPEIEFREAPPENNLEYHYKPKTTVGEKRQFRSLRRQQPKVFNLAEPDSEEDDEINPIAKQAAGIRTAF